MGFEGEHSARRPDEAGDPEHHQAEIRPDVHDRVPRPNDPATDAGHLGIEVAAGHNIQKIE